MTTILFYIQTDSQSEVMVAGDPERKHMEKCDNQGGIWYHPNQIKNAVSYLST